MYHLTIQLELVEVSIIDIDIDIVFLGAAAGVHVNWNPNNVTMQGRYQGPGYVDSRCSSGIGSDGPAVEQDHTYIDDPTLLDVGYIEDMNTSFCSFTMSESIDTDMETDDRGN